MFIINTLAMILQNGLKMYRVLKIISVAAADNYNFIGQIVY